MVETYRNKEVLLITIPASKLFAPNEVEVRKEAASLLAPLKRYLREPDMYRVLLVMHTDNTGSEKYREHITEERSTALFDWFVKEGCDTRYLFSYAYGDDMPLVENNSLTNREQASNGQCCHILLSLFFSYSFWVIIFKILFFLFLPAQAFLCLARDKPQGGGSSHGWSENCSLQAAYHHHTRRRKDNVEIAGIVRRNPADREDIPAEIPVVGSIKELQNVDVAILATPTRSVEEHAKEILRFPDPILPTAR